MIEEQHIRFVAAADVTDDCRVEVHLRKPRQALTPSQARELAAEIILAAGHAECAAQELLHEHEPARFDLVGQVQEVAAEIGATVIVNDLISPDCRAGKHPSWHDDAWDVAADVEVPCECPCHTDGAAA